MDAQGNVQKDSQDKDICVITDGTAPEKWTTGGHSNDVTENNQKYHFDKATLENGEYYDSFNDPTYRTDAKYDWYYVNDNNGTNKEAMFDPVKGENVTWDVDKKNGKLPNVDLIYKQKGQYNIHYIDVTGSTKTTEYTPDDGILLPDADWEIANIGQGKFAGDSTDASSDIADRQDKFKDKYVEVQEDPNLGKLTIEPNMKDQYVYLVRKANVQHETKKATRTIHYVANTVDGKQLKDDTRQSVTLNGTYYTDAVTGKRVATKTVNEQTVVDPSEPVSETWTVDPTTVADLTTDQKGFKAVTTPQTISLTTRDAQSRGVNSGNWDLIDHQDNGDVSYGDPHDTAWTSATPKEVTEAYLIYSQPTQPTKPTTNPTAPTQLSAPTPATPGQVTTLNQQPTSPVRQTLPAAQSTSARLPQTGSQHEKGALVLGLTALMAVLGLAGHRRKQN